MAGVGGKGALLLLQLRIRSVDDVECRGSVRPGRPDDTVQIVGASSI